MLLPLVSSLAALAVTPDADDSLLNLDTEGTRVRLHLEAGMLAPLAHTIQFGKDGTEIDYLSDGGQDNLFAFTRFSADFDLGQRHSVVFLHQPLDLRSRAVLSRDLVIDDAVFAKDSAVDFRYGFSFYRGSWMYDLAADPDRELAVGLSLQIRNATIDFSSTDGETNRTNRDVGPVPILKARGRMPVGEQDWWVGFEADGFYAPVSYLNGDNNDVIGAILDSSVRAGTSLKSGAEAFVNVRYLGGGSQGQSDSPTYPSDGWTTNWLHLMTVGIGVSLR